MRFNSPPSGGLNLKGAGIKKTIHQYRQMSLLQCTSFERSVANEADQGTALGRCAPPFGTGEVWVCADEIADTAKDSLAFRA